MEHIIEKRSKFDTDYDNILWTLKARSTDPMRRPICNAVGVEGGVWCSTDGHRLHVCVPEREMPDGIYKVAQATKKMIVLCNIGEVINFPDWSRVFPRHTVNSIPEVTSSWKYNYNTSIDFESYIVNHILRKGLHAYNIHYLLDACRPDMSMRFEQCEGIGPLIVRYEDDNQVAMVMPFKE